jgi:hypothetical protein
MQMVSPRRPIAPQSSKNCINKNYIKAEIGSISPNPAEKPRPLKAEAFAVGLRIALNSSD